jgi:hypothetical protein
MGSAFLFGGLLGIVPGDVKDGMNFGIFMVNTPHNILHVVSGAIFLIASMIGARATRLWFQVFGLVYAGTAVWDFQVGDGIICGMISNKSIRQLGACRACRPTSCLAQLLDADLSLRVSNAEAGNRA